MNYVEYLEMKDEYGRSWLELERTEIGNLKLAQKQNLFLRFYEKVKAEFPISIF